MSSHAPFTPGPEPRTGAAAAPWAWWAFGLAFVPPVLLMLGFAGLGTERIGFVGIIALVLSVVFAVLALARGSRPRWPAIIALVVTGLYVAVFAVFLVWALLGLTQLMFAPTY